MARPAPARVLSALAIAAIAVALIRSVAAVWFSSEIIETPPNDEIASPALTDRVMLVVIDGLRYDTALESDLMPHLQAIALAGASGLSMASQVTMTGLGVRTLGTGTSPALADLLLESRLPAITFDNVFAALRRRGDHFAWLGNPSWRELFGAYIDRDARIDRSLEVLAGADNVWAADRVIVRRGVQLLVHPDWQLAIVHLGGLDNASHRFTPFGERFRDKARAVDADLARLVAAADARTTVIITSDHGTSDRGHHGSGEPITRRTPLVLTGRAIAHGARLEARQVDVAPTIAALLGLPIPAPSEGEVLVDALDAPPAVAGALRDANLRQLQRYGRAYAAARGLEPPAIDAAHLHALGDWIEGARASSSLVPALWAVSLALLALALFGAPSWVGAAAIPFAIWSFASGGRDLLPALPATGAAALATLLALRGLPRRRLVVGLAAIAAIEVALVLWKLNHRLVEMKMHDVYRAVHLDEAAFGLVATIVAAIAAAFAARRWWPEARWPVIGLVVAAAALADTIAIPAALVAGAAATAAVASPALVLAVAAGLAGIAVADGTTALPLDVLAPLVLALLGARLGPSRERGQHALGALGVLAAIVRLEDNPPLLYKATLVAILATAIVVARLDRDDRPLAMIGWCGAIALAMLSRSAQLPGLVAWTAFAALAGRARLSILGASFTAVAFRFACFALFEGVFEFSHLEVWLAYEGNPGTQVAFGAAIIAIKFALPLAIGLALTTAEMTAEARRTATAWTIAFLCLRIAHIVLGMTIARGTFYSPYLDSGQLAFTCLMLASAPIVLALFRAARV